MLRYVYGNELNDFDKIQSSMFRDRADQFKTRLNWAVSVDSNGFERDRYDDLNPLYVIWEDRMGRHGGSMRLLPTTGPTMINDHFAQLTGGEPIVSPLIWECTRFCLARGAGQQIAAALMLAGGEVMRHFGIAHYVGVFDARMERIYRLIGSSPEVVGQQGAGRDRISVGLWEFTDAARARLARRAGLSPAVSELWFSRSFGALKPNLAKTA